MTRKTVYVAAALLKDTQGRILLAQRPAHKPMPFLWELPGGKVEPGETPESALVRELFEELGLMVLPHHLVPLTFVSYAYSDFHLIMLIYQCLHWTGTLHPKEGQGGLDWVAPQDLPRYPTPEADKALFQNLADQ